MLAAEENAVVPMGIERGNVASRSALQLLAVKQEKLLELKQETASYPLVVSSVRFRGKSRGAMALPVEGAPDADAKLEDVERGPLDTFSDAETVPAAELTAAGLGGCPTPQGLSDELTTQDIADHCASPVVLMPPRDRRAEARLVAISAMSREEAAAFASRFWSAREHDDAVRAVVREEDALQQHLRRSDESQNRQESHVMFRETFQMMYHRTQAPRMHGVRSSEMGSC